MIVLYKHTLGTNDMCHMDTVADVRLMAFVLKNIALRYEHLGKAAQTYVAVHLDTVRPVMRLLFDGDIYAVSIGEPELEILALQNRDNGMFTLGLEPEKEKQEVLNKLIQHGLVRFANINPILGPSLFCIYQVTPFAQDWLESMENRNL